MILFGSQQKSRAKKVFKKFAGLKKKLYLCTRNHKAMVPWPSG